MDTQSVYTRRAVFQTAAEEMHRAAESDWEGTDFEKQENNNLLCHTPGKALNGEKRRSTTHGEGAVQACPLCVQLFSHLTLTRMAWCVFKPFLLFHARLLQHAVMCSCTTVRIGDVSVWNDIRRGGSGRVGVHAGFSLSVLIASSHTQQTVPHRLL